MNVKLVSFPVCWWGWFLGVTNSEGIVGAQSWGSQKFRLLPLLKVLHALDELLFALLRFTDPWRLIVPRSVGQAIVITGDVLTSPQLPTHCWDDVICMTISWKGFYKGRGEERRILCLAGSIVDGGWNL